MEVSLYRQVGKGKARRYQKVNLGRLRSLTKGKDAESEEVHDHANNSDLALYA